MVGLNKIWTDRGITKATKKRLVSGLIFPIATYGCESWTLTKADQSRITSFEMWCWRRMLRISWFMERSNISVLEEIQPKRRLLSQVQSQMMKYFGHIARRGGDSLKKVIMQGCVEGRRKPGRPRTRWIDQIKSMVGCPHHELYNLVQDRQRWCVVVVASCQSWQDRTDRRTTWGVWIFKSTYIQCNYSIRFITVGVNISFRSAKWGYLLRIHTPTVLDVS